VAPALPGSAGGARAGSTPVGIDPVGTEPVGIVSVGTAPIEDPPEGAEAVGAEAVGAEAPVSDAPRKARNGFGVRPRPAPVHDREVERGLRGLVGSGSSQVSVGAALRARDAARPTDAQLAEAEQDLTIVRRNWTPREDLPRR
jgi:hypothetical protein